MTEVIVAFDVETADDAFRLADRLPALRWAKVGPVLYVRHGHRIVEAFRQRGIRVFLDLKWHDIPNTVAGAVTVARDLGVELATVHALGGREMIEAAVEAAGSMRVAAVSVLTSHDAAGYGEAVGRPVPDVEAEVARLVGLGTEAGARAVVTSPREVAALRGVVPRDTWLVVPGIRPVGSNADDQRRTAEPEAAAAAGATHLVVGRPITRSPSPNAVYEGICAAIS